MVAIVNKMSDSKKSILVAVKMSKYQAGYSFAWASAAGETFKKGDILNDFIPTGREPIINEDGTPRLYDDGNPVLRWTF